MKIVKIITEFITLGQFLKLQNIIQSGAFAKTYLLETKVLVNNEPENRRGRKLYEGYEVIIDQEKYKIGK